MIQYNPKDWFKLIFHFHRTDTFRKLCGVIFAIVVYSFVIAFVEIEILNLKYKSTLAIHSLLGFVISMLLVFRTNTAYDRWWEGRKQWGSLLNSSRNLAMKLAAILPKSDIESRKYYATMFGLYAKTLKEHLRNKQTQHIVSSFDNDELKAFYDKKHLPNAIAQQLQERIHGLAIQKVISDGQLIILNNDITTFTEICGACERIKRTPIPYTYSLFIKKFIFVYTVTMPFGFIADFKYWCIPIIAFIFYTLASLELIAEEIEDPFGKDANDLPIDEIAVNIENSVNEILLN